MNNLAYKSELTEKQLYMVEKEYEDKKIKTHVMWLLFVFLGGIGIHRFYMKDSGYASAMLLLTIFVSPFTFGLLTVTWIIVELFLIQKRMHIKNADIEKDIIRSVKIMTDK